MVKGRDISPRLRGLSEAKIVSARYWEEVAALDAGAEDCVERLLAVVQR
jgi:hypothetical protein